VAFLRENIPKQPFWNFESMGCRREDLQTYTVSPCGYSIRNGKHFHNRPLYSPNRFGWIWAGDRPHFSLALPYRRLGTLSILLVRERESLFAHECEEITFSYDLGPARYLLRDPILDGGQLLIEVVSFHEEAGFSLRLSRKGLPRGLAAYWVFGGIAPAVRDFDLPPLAAADCENNTLAKQGCWWKVERRGFEDWVPERALGAGSKPWRAPREFSRSFVCWHPETRALVAEAEMLLSSRRIQALSNETGRPLLVSEIAFRKGKAYFLAVMKRNPDLKPRDLAAAHRLSLARTRRITNRAEIRTPELELNTAFKACIAATDGCWRPPGILHGSIRWGDNIFVWESGWRNAYAPEVLGWHDRVEEAIKFHAGFQHTGKFPAGHKRKIITDGIRVTGPIFHSDPLAGIPHVAGRFWQAVPFSKVYPQWPEDPPQWRIINHDRQAVFMDWIRYHFLWSADLELIRDIFHRLKKAMKWAKRELDPDGDGLYENVVLTHISDGHWYSGGGCTQASAYYWRLNLAMASYARHLGEDPRPFQAEAQRIEKAVKGILWLPDEGHFAEYREYLGHGRLHPNCEAPSIYHPIEFGLADDFETYQMLAYLRRKLWWKSSVNLVRVNNWLPAVATNTCLGSAETLNSAIAFYRGGDAGRGTKLLLGCTRAFSLAKMPGMLSEYLGDDGEQALDPEHNDCVSMFVRTVVEGLFGIYADLPSGRFEIHPGFPDLWSEASIRLPDISYEYRRHGNRQQFHITSRRRSAKLLCLKMERGSIKEVRVNGKVLRYSIVPRVGRADLLVEIPAGKRHEVQVVYKRKALPLLSFPPVVVREKRLRAEALRGKVSGLYDPQGLLSDVERGEGFIEGKAGKIGPHIFFVRLTSAEADIWEPVEVEVRNPVDIESARIEIAGDARSAILKGIFRNNSSRRITGTLNMKSARRRRFSIAPREEISIEHPLDVRVLVPGTHTVLVNLSGPQRLSLEAKMHFWRLWQFLPGLRRVHKERFHPLDISAFFNDHLEKIFRRNYTEPRSPFPSSLEVRRNGLNAWTGSFWKPELITAALMRSRVAPGGIFMTDIGIPFRQVRRGPNAVFVSFFKPFPREVEIPVGKSARRIYFLVGSSTNCMNSEIENGRIEIFLSDGTRLVKPLVNPETLDHFNQHFSEGYPQVIGGEEGGFTGIDNFSACHIDVLDIELPDKVFIERLRLKILSIETFIGLFGITLYE